MNRFVTEMSKEKIEELRELFAVSGWEMKQPQYTVFQAKTKGGSCTGYNSGKVVIQGKETAMIMRDYLGLIAPETSIPPEPATDEHFVPHIGIDESGKGDYFGPLVTAAVYVDETSREKLIRLGVQDSKNIKNDKKILAMAAEIKRICYNSWSLIHLGNAKYNELYDKIGNLNRLLAWCHATVLENTLEKQPQCKLAISDQFAKSKQTVISQLKDMGKQIELIQMTKAEADIAVAAASIIARAEFVTRMQNMSLALRLTENLPKGASAKVKETAKQLYSQIGTDIFNYVKKHFKTTNEL